MSDNIQNEIDSLDEVQVPSTNEEFYSHLKLMVESMEADVLKTERGNKAAATRLRKSLRLIKTTSANFVKFTLGKL
jgi:hypothetical protein